MLTLATKPCPISSPRFKRGLRQVSQTTCHAQSGGSVPSAGSEKSTKELMTDVVEALKELKHGQDSLKHGQDSLKHGQDTLKRDVKDLKRDVKDLRCDINQLQRKASLEDERRMRWSVAPQIGEDNVQQCTYDELISLLVRYAQSGQAVEGKVVYNAESWVVEAAIEVALKLTYPYRMDETRASTVLDDLVENLKPVLQKLHKEAALATHKDLRAVLEDFRTARLNLCAAKHAAQAAKKSARAMEAGKAVEEARKALEDARAACKPAKEKAKLAKLPGQRVKDSAKQQASQTGQCESHKEQTKREQKMPAYVAEAFPLSQHMNVSKLDDALHVKMKQLKALWNLRVKLLTEAGGASSYETVQLTGCNVFILGLLVYASDPQLYDGKICKAKSLKALAEAMPQGTLQCDCRGNAYSFGSAWVVRMAEMKSSPHSSEWEKGIQQLAIRLRAVGKALQLCQTKLEGRRLRGISSVSLVGVLIVNPQGKKLEHVQQCVRDHESLYKGSPDQGTESVEIKVLFCE